MLEGDRNTSLYRSNSKYIKRNNTRSIVNDINEELEEANEIRGKDSYYFLQTYSHFIGEDHDIMDKLIDQILFILDEVNNTLLLSLVRKEEVKSVVFSMEAYKALGLVGFP